MNITNTHQNKDSYLDILKLALPLMGTSIAFSCMMFFNRIFLGMYNVEHLAAVGSAGWVSFTIGSFAFGIIGYVSTLTSNYVGAQKLASLTAPMWQGIYFATLISIIILLGISPFAKSIFEYFDHDASLIPLETTYLQLLLITTSINFFTTALSGFLLGNKKTTLVMIANMSAILMNIGLDYWFILGGWGIQAMGVKGAGLATIGGAITSLTLCLFFSYRLAKQLGIKFFAPYNRAETKTLLRFGMPASLQLTVASLGPTFLGLAMGKLSPLMLLSYTIVGSIQAMFYMPFYGVSSAMSILVGQSAGAHQFFRLTPLLRKTIMICLVYFLLLAPIFILGYAPLIKIFVNKDQLDQLADVTKMTKPIFLILSLIMFIQSLQGIFIQFLKTLGDTKFIFFAYTSTLGLVWILPTALALKIEQTLLSILLPMMIFHITIAGICWHRYTSEKWMKTLVTC